MNSVLPLLRAIGKQRVLERGKVGLLHRLAGPHKLKPQRFEVDFFGYRYSGDLSNYIDWMVYMTGCYEPGILKLLSDLAGQLRSIGRPVHYVDVGANVGHHALYMSRFADQVTAFEPFPRVANEIRRKVESNGLSNLRLFPVALGDSDAELPLQIDDAVNLGTASLDPTRSAHPIPVGVVPVRRGDTLFEREALPRIDILKVDVEGFEASAIAGLRRRILADRPIILTELSGAGYSEFGSETGFRAALYPDHVLYAVELRGAGYDLGPYTPKAGEVVCLPEDGAVAGRSW